MQCNIWHVRGRDRDLLVDTGMGIASLQEAAHHLFDKPLTAVATHTHLDHVGSLHEFTERVVHHAEAERMTGWSENFSMLRQDHPVELIAALERAGYEVDPCFITALPHADFNLRQFACPPAPPSRRVGEGGRCSMRSPVATSPPTSRPCDVSSACQPSSCMGDMTRVSTARDCGSWRGST
jgi:hypothetical protein